MTESKPRLVILTGPNGAGKSTAARSLLRGALGVDEYVNADAIAQGLSGFEPQRAALQAGRVTLQRLKQLAAERADFAFETTLASRTFAGGTYRRTKTVANAQLWEEINHAYQTRPQDADEAEEADD